VPHSRDEDWIMTYEVNVKGVVNATNATVPSMREARSGKIVNIASIAGRQGRPSLPHYSASKSAVINYTQSLANELAAFNVNVNAICPGLLWTPMWDQVGARYAQNNPAYMGLSSREVFTRMIADNIPLGREQTPDDVGDLVALDDYALASRMSYFLWNTMPDDELFDVAAAGELVSPSTVEAQAAIIPHGSGIYAPSLAPDGTTLPAQPGTPAPSTRSWTAQADRTTPRK
jgi:NAD(P)-dependent dehydrogenase (short-subunit alcohol dehydrogenase family)